MGVVRFTCWLRRGGCSADCPCHVMKDLTAMDNSSRVIDDVCFAAIEKESSSSESTVDTLGCIHGWTMPSLGEVIRTVAKVIRFAYWCWKGGCKRNCLCHLINLRAEASAHPVNVKQGSSQLFTDSESHARPLQPSCGEQQDTTAVIQPLQSCCGGQHDTAVEVKAVHFKASKRTE